MFVKDEYLFKAETFRMCSLICFTPLGRYLLQITFEGIMTVEGGWIGFGILVVATIMAVNLMYTGIVVIRYRDELLNGK